MSTTKDVDVKELESRMRSLVEESEKVLAESRTSLEKSKEQSARGESLIGEAVSIWQQIAAAKSPTKSRWEQRADAVFAQKDEFVYLYGHDIYNIIFATTDTATRGRERLCKWFASELSAAAESGNFTEENVVKALKCMEPTVFYTLRLCLDSPRTESDIAQFASILVSAFNRTKGVGNGK